MENMNLEEAINILKETQDSYLKDELDYAIEVVLTELNKLQEENKELRRGEQALIKNH